jgi:hypothetical protein
MVTERAVPPIMYVKEDDNFRLRSGFDELCVDFFADSSEAMSVEQYG